MSRASAEAADPAEPGAPTGGPGADTLLGEGARFEGLLVLPGAARLDGHVRGRVVAHGPLRIGPSGRIEADLEASHLEVEGRVEGDLRASELIALGPGARVEGALCAPRLRIAEGARIEGRCRSGPGVAGPSGQAPAAS